MTEQRGHNTRHTAPSAKGAERYARDTYVRRERKRTSVREGSRSAKRRLPLLAGVAAVALLVCLVVAQSGLTPSGEGDGDSTLVSGIQALTGDDAAQANEHEVSLPTPYIAVCDGVYLHSAVAAEDLTEILIHNASYSYALELTTELTEATNVDVIAAHGTGRVASEQPTGDAWMTGEFIRCFRSTNAGPTLSAIDCGGAVGTTVYAPVSGTVVRVKEYDLYDNPEYPDVMVHIQPEGRDDLDVVLIHLTNPTVQEGDVVVGGETPIASIRDVYAYIGDEMQLKDYTAEGDNGNHTHIQVNDVNNKDYHGLD